MNRLFELVLLLMDSEKMTTKQIATYFEISQRTVLRDLDKLLVAGIPIETTQGYQGGISIDKAYRLTIDFMNKQEKEALLAGLQAIDSIQENPLLPILTRKIFQQPITPQTQIKIDLASWHATSLKPKIELIKEILILQKQLSFIYYNEKKEQLKVVSPYQIVFKWGNWYLRGICEEKNAFRLYKLNRMEQLKMVDQTAQFMPFEEDEDQYFEQANLHLYAKFNQKAQAQLIDTYGKQSFITQKDGLHFQQPFTNKTYMLSWLLSFGDLVEVIEPVEIRQELKKISRSIYKIYEHDK